MTHSSTSADTSRTFFHAAPLIALFRTGARPYRTNHISTFGETSCILVHRSPMACPLVTGI